MRPASVPARPYPGPVEILGNAGPADDPPLLRGRDGARAAVDLDLGTARVGESPLLDDELLDGGGEDAFGGRSAVLGALGAVISPAALGLAALVVDVIGFSAGSPTALWIDHGPGGDGDGPPQNPYSGFLTYLAVIAAVGLALGVGGLLRLPREPGPLGRALTGAAVVVSTLLLVYTGLSMMRAGSLTELG